MNSLSPFFLLSISWKRQEDIRKVFFPFDPGKLQKGLPVSRVSKQKRDPRFPNPVFRHARHGVNNICFSSRRDRITERKENKKRKGKEKEMTVSPTTLSISSRMAASRLLSNLGMRGCEEWRERIVL